MSSPRPPGLPGLIKTAMDTHNTTLTDLAHTLNIGYDAARRRLSGETKFTPHDLAIVSTTLNLPPAAILAAAAPERTPTP